MSYTNKEINRYTWCADCCWISRVRQLYSWREQVCEYNFKMDVRVKPCPGVGLLVEGPLVDCYRYILQR